MTRKIQHKCPVRSQGFGPIGTEWTCGCGARWRRARTFREAGAGRSTWDRITTEAR